MIKLFKVKHQTVVYFVVCSKKDSITSMKDFFWGFIWGPTYDIGVHAVRASHMSAPFYLGVYKFQVRKLNFQIIFNLKYVLLFHAAIIISCQHQSFWK